MTSNRTVTQTILYPILYNNPLYQQCIRRSHTTTLRTQQQHHHVQQSTDNNKKIKTGIVMLNMGGM